MPTNFPPLGIAYIAAVLRKNCFDVEILDPAFKGWEIAEKRLKDTDYDILGISTLTSNFEDGLEMAKIAKQANPNCIIVFGGIHSTLFADDVIQIKEVDIVCIGEGEYTMLELVQAIDCNGNFSKIEGIVYKDGENIIKNKPRPVIQNLDDLPFPARDLLPMEEYFQTRVGRLGRELPKRSTSMMASRGCPFKCTFCTSHRTFGRRVHNLSPMNVINEIEYLVDNFKIEGIYFIDDTFTLNSKRVALICSEIRSRGIDIEWMCQGRVDTVSKDMLKDMKKAGCVNIEYGIESGSQRVLDNYLNKGITLKTAENAVKITKEVGMTVVTNFMIGTPGETLEDINKTVEFAKKINPDALFFSITTPLPGSEMFDIANKIGTIKINSFKDFKFNKYPIFESDDLPKDKVFELHKKAEREFYFRIGYIGSQILSIRRRPKATFRILTWLFSKWLSKS